MALPQVLAGRGVGLAALALMILGLVGYRRRDLSAG